MAIEKPRIAAGPTQPRSKFFDQPIRMFSFPPGTSGFTKKNGELEFVEITAEFPGQVYFQQVFYGNYRGVRMYVVVDIDGSLEWKGIETGTAIDPDTGRPYK